MIPTRTALPLLVALSLSLALLAACSSSGPVQPAPVPQPPETAPLAPQPEMTPQQKSALRAELAAGYFERGQLDVALEELGQAVKLDPSNAKAYNLYGLVYALLSQDDKAEQNFQRALSLAPNDSEIRHNWGWYLCTHGKARESIAEFEAALRNPLYRSPESALVNAARCSISFGDVKAAENYFRRALAAAPSDANASYGLARLAYKDGRYQEARNWLRPAVMQAAPAAETLYLGMCIERSLGDRQTELSYVSQLRNRYPDSPEAKNIASGNCSN
jgi:type IV pilus assembly protein PilF